MQVTPPSAASDIRVDALLGALAWARPAGSAALEITYSFPGPSSVWSSGQGQYGAGGSAEPQTFSPLGEELRASVRAALQAWSDVADIRFVETTDDAAGSGVLRFAYTAPAVAEQSHSYGPAAGDKAGDVWLNARADWSTLGPGSYAASTLLHEIGHALGLKHPFEGAVTLPPDQESYANTLMSYTAWAGTPGSWVSHEPSTPMPYDVLAIQALYGANRAHRTGDDVYTWTEGQACFETLWDAGGVDAIEWRSESQGALIDLNAGHFSELGAPLRYGLDGSPDSWASARTVAIAFGTVIENATGDGGDDTLIGNAGANVLTGRGGNDHLDGGAGIDCARYSGPRAAASIELLPASMQHEASVSAPGQGTDTLAGIERLLFDDLAHAFDVDPTGNVDDPRTKGEGGNAGKAYRLYQAALARTPDLPGLGYWIRVIDDGGSLYDIATGFIDSNEFRQAYGSDTTDRQFLTVIYRNVLGREYDPAGFEWWLGVLASHDTTRQQVLVDFSESPENKDNLVGLIGNGFDYVVYTPAG